MSVTQITSTPQFQNLLKGTTCLVADFYADWCGPCHAIRPHYEKLAAAHSLPNHLSFVKVNVDEQAEIAQTYGISAMPTFLFFHKGELYKGQGQVRGADPASLTRLAGELGNVAKEAQAVEAKGSE